MPNTFYTSDTHWYHKNVMQYENRPFETVEEMNEWFIEVWNKTVKEQDIVYHLGDFVFGTYNKWESIVSRLSGKIHLIQGNHDDKKVLKRIGDRFESVNEFLSQKIDGKNFFLFHYPIEIGLTPDTYNISGHIHGRPSTSINQINVGVDSIFTKETVGFGHLIPQEIILNDLPRRKEHIMNLRNSFKP